MTNLSAPHTAPTVRAPLAQIRQVEPPAELPRATPQFRTRAWREFQRAIDPLGPPRPLPR